MTKLEYIMLFTAPSLRTAAGILRRKDANRTGKDDMTADAIDFAVGCMEAIQNGDPLPDLPASLRPQPVTDELLEDVGKGE